MVRVDDGAVTVNFKNAGAEVKSLGDRVKRAAQARHEETQA